MSNSVIETLNAHRTHRNFTDQPVSDATLATIITTAQQAPTSQYLQAYSLVEITDQKVRQQLATITTKPTVATQGRLMVVLADQNRNAYLSATPTAKRALTELDRFMASVEDATLFTEAMVMVTESLGLGSVVLGSINNDTQAVIELLDLPPLTLPVFGFQLGYPATQPERKPRLGLDAILFKDHYAQPVSYQAALTAFDQQLHAYYQQRSSHARDEQLSQLTREALGSAAKRRDFLKVARQQGFLPEIDA
ncbi:nitroreductase family protein [Lactiplantibacillus daowaiensis]|uniref:Nitroreductase family protein n=1 Tax=Lactiplantibacillus daowaiensis TaxID=2559918 RepID=A0ABW1S071_9LACO|nr:nitroreductase family protein [Lactiplantibacillus daowaiensis]